MRVMFFLLLQSIAALISINAPPSTSLIGPWATMLSCFDTFLCCKDIQLALGARSTTTIVSTLEEPQVPGRHDKLQQVTYHCFDVGDGVSLENRQLGPYTFRCPYPNFLEIYESFIQHPKYIGTKLVNARCREEEEAEEEVEEVYAWSAEDEAMSIFNGPYSYTCRDSIY